MDGHEQENVGNRVGGISEDGFWMDDGNGLIWLIVPIELVIYTFWRRVSEINNSSFKMVFRLTH